MCFRLEHVQQKIYLKIIYFLYITRSNFFVVILVKPIPKEDTINIRGS